MEQPRFQHTLNDSISLDDHKEFSFICKWRPYRNATPPSTKLSRSIMIPNYIERFKGSPTSTWIGLISDWHDTIHCFIMDYSCCSKSVFQFKQCNCSTLAIYTNFLSLGVGTVVSRTCNL